MTRTEIENLGKDLGIDKKYLDAILSAPEIKLLVIGLDPFPQMSINIPFCKENWSDLKKDTGYRVFSSILNMGSLVGIDATPKEKAIDLARHGIIFLNSSYLLLRMLKGSAKEKAKFDGYNFNQYFINNAPTGAIICMGKAHIFTGKYMSDKGKLTKVFHAAAFPIYRDNVLWADYWTVGALKRKFKLPTV